MASDEKERKRWSICLEEEPFPKKNKTSHQPNPFETNCLLLDEQLQHSLLKFRKASEEEIFKLTSLIGLDFPSAVNTIIDKIRSDRDAPFVASQEEISHVMKLGGFTNEDDAVKALIVREELVNLRRSGLAPPEAIDALINRIKALIGLKRKNNEPRNNNNNIHQENIFSEPYLQDIANIQQFSSDHQSACNKKKLRKGHDLITVVGTTESLITTHCDNTTLNDNNNCHSNGGHSDQNIENFQFQSSEQSVTTCILEKKRTRGLSQETFELSPSKKLKPKS